LAMGVGLEGGFAGVEEEAEAEKAEEWAGMGLAWWRYTVLLPAPTIAGCRTPQAPAVRRARLRRRSCCFLSHRVPE